MEQANRVLRLDILVMDSYAYDFSTDAIPGVQ